MHGVHWRCDGIRGTRVTPAAPHASSSLLSMRNGPVLKEALDISTPLCCVAYGERAAIAIAG